MKRTKSKKGRFKKHYSSKTNPQKNKRDLRNNIISVPYTQNSNEDFDVLLDRYQYDKDFSKKLNNEAKALFEDYQKTIENHSKQRLDLQNETIITIDGEQAKDFDDAVSVQKSKTGYEVGVHIADVSHFISMEDELDIEARKRATSVYLLNKVIPMFPEVISNQLCSLVEKEPRLTFSCLMKIDFKGKIENFKFVKSIIKSKKRCTYEEVQEVLDGKKKIEAKIDKQIKLMEEIKNILYQKRMNEGSIEFETQEQEIDYKHNQITGIRRKKRLVSEMIIEELMLITNQCAAQLMNQHSVGIYRTHDAPEQRKLTLFEKKISAYNVNWFSDQKMIQKSSKKNKKISFSTNPLKDKKPNKYQVFLASLEDEKSKKLFSFLLLTSMKKAEYQGHCGGHYGLAFKKYSHFTSPIRRYPDLVAHHIIGDIIKNQSIKITKGEVVRIAKWSSLQERKAVISEREYKKLKMIRYLKDRLPYEFKGVIVKILSRGMYIEEEKTGIEGFLNSRFLLRNNFSYDYSQEIFVNNLSSKYYQLGQEVKVEVCKLSTEKLYVDLDII